MKTRAGYVSNSSSSSFVIAYDKSLFGDLAGDLNECGFGFETSARELKDGEWKDVLEEFWFGDEDGKRLEAGMKAAMASGKSLMALSIDVDFIGVVKLLRHIDQAAGGGKLDVLWGEEDN